MCAAQVPPLEESKGIILKAKGAAWLKEQEARFDQTYGKSIPDPAFKMWLIAKQNGIEVTEIKAAADGSEGEPMAIAEMRDRVKGIKGDQGKAHGWTYVNGGDFDQPDDQSKYSLTAVILAVEDKGTTKKGGPKMDYLVTDGTGVGKVGANGDSVQMMVEAKAKPGSVIRFPLLNINYGFHNFGKTPDTLWWKFSLPPFDNAAVVPMERDVNDFFLSMDKDVVKAEMPCRITGFITHIDERTNEVCSLDGRWITEKQPHEECQALEGFEVVEKTSWSGTSTSVTGQTNKLNFESKPKIKVAVDLVEIYGKMNKVNAIDVAFIRKVGAGGVTETVAAPKPAASPAKKVVAKPVLADEPDEGLPEEITEDELAEATAPTKVVGTAGHVKRPAPKPMPKPAPEPEPEEEPEEGTEEEPVEEPEQAVVVVTPKRRPATPSQAPAAAPAKPTPAKTAPKAVAQQAEAVEVPEIPEAILQHIEKACKQFGGTNQIFVICRSAIRTDVIKGDNEDALMEEMKGHVESAIAAGYLEYAGAAKNRVTWVG